MFQNEVPFFLQNLFQLLLKSVVMFQEPAERNTSRQPLQLIQPIYQINNFTRAMFLHSKNAHFVLALLCFEHSI
jgi:hypothetical protein